MTSPLFFDRQDHELLKIINDIIKHGPTRDSEHKIFSANLHPHGIIELTTTHEYRMAYAVLNLFGSIIKSNLAEDRLIALRALRDEVLHSAQTPFRYNTGRVLIQIMKEIIRSRDNEFNQLKLVHDFRKAASGNPRLVRAFLSQHHLIEMPEAWDQLTMDHHVHDANTKGRKNPTHLIMDAWIKGIRNLTVIYYNYVEPAAARELLQAAEIMDLSVRIGLEFRVRFRGRFVNFVWAPRGFSNPEDFLAFLAERPVVALMKEGQKVSLWMKEHVMRTLRVWNSKHAPALAEELGIPVPQLDPEAFLAFVRTGQPSFLHLAEFAHKILLPHLKKRVNELGQELKTAPERSDELLERIHKMDALTTEFILKTWIRSESNPELPSPDVPREAPDTPELLLLQPHVLLGRLSALRSGYRITLQLAGLSAEDVLELLWDGQGMITHLEMFNLKEWQEGTLRHLGAINDLQMAINDGSVLRLKQILRIMIARLEMSTDHDDIDRCEKFRAILRNIPSLQAPYKVAPLRSRIGTDSTSHSGNRHGMGLVFPDSLPNEARKQLLKNRHIRTITLPVKLKLIFRDVYQEPAKTTWVHHLFGLFMRQTLGLQKFGLSRQREWRAISSDIHIEPNGNVITMGGIGGNADNGLCAAQAAAVRGNPAWAGLPYLNTTMSNILKILIGFIPALFTFLYTQDWWVLAWLGAPIWFVITGVRNVAQAILAGGGLHKDSLLRWNNLVSWSRICDSLMYTGLSVVLLEWLIRCLLLKDLMGMTVDTHPLLVFSIIAGANSVYISAHNIYRGFPRAAVIGNLFRSALAIPMSILFNDILALILPFFTAMPPEEILIPCAAIISKTASDTVAAIIEAIADRRNNYRLRNWDYLTKIQSLFDSYTKLELAFPDRDILELLAQPRDFIKATAKEFKLLQVESIINVLDLMYFWFYQPCAHQTLLAILRDMTREERAILARFQGILCNIREVSQLFVDGLLGSDFARALSFYLDKHEDYINIIAQRCYSVNVEKH